MFSPYYAWARGQSGVADPENFCALNVALYGPRGQRWAMTERGKRWVQREARDFHIGPSHVHWDGQALVLDIDEICVPLPRRLRGRVRLVPSGLCRFTTGLDAAARHRWGPIAPCARVEVDLCQPGVRWSGPAYMDSNEGDEPVDRAFRTWDWSRSAMADGSTSVVYDVRPVSGPQRVIAQRFAPDGSSAAFMAPPRQPLPASAWRIERGMHSTLGQPPQLLRTLEDTPFYVRSTLRGHLQGETVTAVHETLHVPRVVSWPVRLMLPWRMPRRG